MKKTLIILLALTSLVNAEPSAFSAGDLSQESPYGLDPNEKLLLNNIKSVKTLNRDKNTLYSEVETLRSDLDGLRTVIQGLNLQQQQHTKEYKTLVHMMEDSQLWEQKSEKEMQGVVLELKVIKESIKAFITTQEQNYKNIQETFRIIDSTISVIETNYVSKKTFLALENEVRDLRQLVVDEFKKLNNGTLGSKKNKSPAETFNDAKRALDDGHYESALTLFSESIKANYKPATSHYYSAEAFFALKRYTEAIAFYKESYKRYKNGSYNPKLFLHTAIALENSGQKKSALSFYHKVIDMYPNSSEAKTAQKALK